MEFVDVGTELFGIDLDQNVNSQKAEEETVEKPPEDLVSKPLPYQFELIQPQVPENVWHP